jgi:hypothetical protein
MAWVNCCICQLRARANVAIAFASVSVMVTQISAINREPRHANQCKCCKSRHDLPEGRHASEGAPSRCYVSKTEELQSCVRQIATRGVSLPTQCTFGTIDLFATSQDPACDRRYDFLAQIHRLGGHCTLGVVDNVYSCLRCIIESMRPASAIPSYGMRYGSSPSR